MAIDVDGFDTNLEIDGPSHILAIKKTRDERRDKYLNSKGVSVIRVSCFEENFESALIAKINSLFPSSDSKYDFPVRYCSI